MCNWVFSLTHAITLLGYVVTSVIAYFGFRTFERWKREKIEEKRIEIAIEALALAYDSQTVFASIRNPGSTGQEWQDMPRRPGESDDDWGHRGPFYAIVKRVQSNQTFFESLAKLRPRYGALFGVNAADSFNLINEARATVLVSAQFLCFQQFVGPNGPQMRTQMECDIWEGMGEVYLADHPNATRVDIKLRRFVAEIERHCRPIIDRSYAVQNREHWWRTKKGK